MSLPTNDDDLEVIYTAQEKLDIASNNNVRVAQSAIGQFAIHQYKEYAGAETKMRVTWEGQTNTRPSSYQLLLQIYNRVTPVWETIASDIVSPADIDFYLSASVSDLTNYKDGNSVVSFRICQEGYG